MRVGSEGNRMAKSSNTIPVAEFEFFRMHILARSARRRRQEGRRGDRRDAGGYDGHTRGGQGLSVPRRVRPRHDAQVDGVGPQENLKGSCLGFGLPAGEQEEDADHRLEAKLN